MSENPFPITRAAYKYAAAQQKANSYRFLAGHFVRLARKQVAGAEFGGDN